MLDLGNRRPEWELSLDPTAPGDPTGGAGSRVCMTCKPYSGCTCLHNCIAQCKLKFRVAKRTQRHTVFAAWQIGTLKQSVQLHLPHVLAKYGIQCMWIMVPCGVVDVVDGVAGVVDRTATRHWPLCCIADVD
jgi:hypothetical protein